MSIIITCRITQGPNLNICKTNIIKIINKNGMWISESNELQEKRGAVHGHMENPKNIFG